MSDIFNTPASEFAQHISHLYHGPFVTIKLKPSDAEYTVSKPLLCKKSSYFEKMFEGEFIEGQTQTVEMQEIEGIVSEQSFVALLQWLYHRRVEFGTDDEPDEEITAAIELARLADMCNVKELETEMAEYIKKVLIKNPEPDGWKDINTYHLTEEHIRSAHYLPPGHSVRYIIATASVEGFLKDDGYKFADMAQECPTFGADLLLQVRLALNSVDYDDRPMVKDPLTGKEFRINTYTG
ncbi:uncharacterized protein N7496_003306 [Penicillium cataractarum]|uniref:BTB domain-containing protein n=1 Tax=Penicillium cataractarum TaxID=2100454 RepID=A0A9W9SQZ0_9EURO|nr:uncharacterized protein N7496_003306 [Penicillium cataractarum]KAJ5380878.1 hypothetical protein N7496_003306 [Penicillium cataractarum]